MARCKQTFTLYWCDTGSPKEPKAHEFKEGEEVKVIHTFDDVYVIRNTDDKVFNVKKDLVDA